jgi:asparagine synthase (glutamine-hydrolysing)
MCGIVGIASARGAPNVETVIRMRDTLRHRGPDDEGVWREDDGTVVLGHRRLSIIDLSPGGHQPMSDVAAECQIVYNGEIYNYRELREELIRLGHRLRSASDTEVILEAYRAWGTDCVKRLNGMFAFVIYDRARRRIFAARDRAGEKPFFYRHEGSTFAFASELKAHFGDPACPRTLDVSALESYLAFGYVPGTQCIVQGIRKLPQGHALVYEVAENRLRTWPYWTLPEPQPAADADDDELLERLEHTLLESVRARLIADVPVGIMLSGGVDSSLVTAMAARVAGRVKTYTISFRGHGQYDEAAYARVVADHFGTDHTVLDAEPATVDLVPTLVRQFDEPLADSSMVPTYLVARMIRREAAVALGGDGADELFGGYPHHSWIQSQARVRTLIPAPVGRMLRPAATALLPIGMRGRNFLVGLTGDREFGVSQFNQFFDPATRRQLLEPLGVRSESDAPETYKAGLGAGATALQQVTAADFRSYLVDDILVKVDRAAMLSSLEVRAPWLDPALIELAFAHVPDRLRATARERKILPRRLAAKLLPRTLDLTRKQGFSLPLNAWFSGHWGTFFRETLAGDEPSMFNRDIVDRLFAGQHNGRSNMHRLFGLTVFELWRREYGISLG